MRAMVAMMLALGAGGCGGGSGNTTADSKESALATGSSWDAMDACSIMSKSVVAATLKAEVTSSKLGAVKDGSIGPKYSQCEFTLADGRMLVFGTAQDDANISPADQIANTRKQIGMISNQPPADLPGMGKAALWSGDVHAMYVALGGGRMVSATVSQVLMGKTAYTGDQARDDSIALLKHAGA